MISSSLSVEATKVTYSGKATAATPSSSTACVNSVSQGRFSTISSRAARRPSVLHRALDEAELDHGERDDDEHQDHRLRRRAAEVGRLDPVVVDLVDEDLGRLPRAALRGGVDHAEGFEEGVNDVHDEQKEGRRRKQREDDGP